MKKITLFLILIITLSCSKGDDNEEELCNGSIYNRCCMQGSGTAAPNEELTFVYTFRVPDAEMLWEINNGDATVVNVENSNSGGETVSVATIRFNGDFSVARISARASTPINEERCRYYYNIRQQE